MRLLFFGRQNCKFNNKLIIYLKSLSLDLEIVLSSNFRNQKLPNKFTNWSGDLIICFRSLYILPKYLIEKPKIGAINFHPAPPEYPGSGGINFALYENQKRFGITVHLMSEKVDSGEILDVLYFPILEKDNVDTLLNKTHIELFKVTKEFINAIQREKSKFILDKLAQSKFVWSDTKRLIKSVDELSVISCQISKDEMHRRIRSFHTNDFPLSININGSKFVYQSE